MLGKVSMEKLYSSSVAVFGLGGVGSFTVEALARSGIGNLDVFDNDRICQTNINRQLIATSGTIGKYKTDVMRERILDINPKAKVIPFRIFFGADNADELDFTKYDYIVDAIDTVPSKLVLIEKAKLYDRPIISCMGAGNKLDPTRFEVTDIYKTSVCPLAKKMRYELRKRGIDSLKVVYSKEPALKPMLNQTDSLGNQGSFILTDIKGNPPNYKKQTPGSVSFVPPVAGLIMAGEVIKDIISFS